MKKITAFELGAAAVLALLGCCGLFIPYISADIVFYAAAGFVSLSAAALLAKAWKRRRGIDFLYAFLCLFLAVILWAHRYTGGSFIVVLFSLYMFGCFLAEFVQYILDVRDQAKNSWVHLMVSLVYLSISVPAFIYRYEDIKLIVRLFGAYLIFQALQILLELFAFSRPGSARDNVFRCWTSLPAYIVCILPAVVLKFMSGKHMCAEKENFDQYKNPDHDPVNLRVFIHTGLEGDHLVGHMTFSYKGIMYSYGNYDKSEEKLFRTTGPGIFFSVPANIYVNNSCIYEGSTIFEFGLHITPEQETKLQNLLSDIYSETYRWYCPIEKQGRRNFAKLEDDYASRLCYRTGAKFRKFYHGQWKTYWILGDNCSLFADDILSQIGCHIVHKSGIVTPGEYFEFFEEEYQNPSSNVIYRSWHDAAYPWSLYPTIA